MPTRKENVAFLQSFDWDKLSDRTIKKLAAEARHGSLKQDEYDPAKEHEVCRCGHPYHRHYDGYENHNDPVGCKYCPCGTFKAPEAGMHVIIEQRYDHNGGMSFEVVCVENMLEWPFPYTRKDKVDPECVQGSVDRLDELASFKGDDEIVLRAQAESQAKEQEWVVVDREELCSILQVRCKELETVRSDFMDMAD